ncbi:MAG: hypothetical protein ACTHQQ_09615 [Solirubrobacteraceae bacterium]
MRKPHLCLLVATTALVSGIALVGSPVAGATNPIPKQLAGQWAIPWQGGTEFLNFADLRFQFSHCPPNRTAKGQVSVSGDTITFFSSNTCTGTGTYRWSVSDGGLTFSEVGSSVPCPPAQVLQSGTWTLR